MKTDELREKYLAFFESKGCVRQPSDVLVPTWDPSVLFTPAGMNQFKDHFLGKVKLDFTKATTCQKCLRTGDIDNVGRTAFHHTFFEMLGNFSFGDYFKREAIHWAWEFLTHKKWLAIDPARLTVTVYKDDDEARRIWRDEVGLPNAAISGMEEDENFWPASAPSLGPDGVCGPCSEIYFRLDDGSSVEIWNLVFTQFNRLGNPPDNLRPLPSQNIDTGMGLERTASVLQGVPTNYHIDILLPIVHAAAEVTGVPYEYKSDHGRRLRRITDHIRACTFAVHENVYPGANGAKYVIRRLIRRAVLDGHQMSMREPFVYKLVGAVADAMKAQYPELSDTIPRVQDVIKSEEERFFATIDVGLDRIEKLFDDMRGRGADVVEGGRAAELYTSYGVPPELLQQMAAEHGFTFDWAGYQASMQTHSEVSGGEQNKLFQTGPLETLKEAIRETPFVGYQSTRSDSIIKGIISGDGHGPDDEGLLLDQVIAGPDEPLRVVLDHTPFYGESGGQVGDTGTIRGDDFVFTVTDTQKHAGLVVHHGTLTRGTMRAGQACVAEVDAARRQSLCRAHSATHILHHALQKNVGSHAQQQGSKVDADWLRFDFSHQKSLSDETLSQIQLDILDRIRADEPIGFQTVTLADARKAGAMMLFGEKYPDPVRMVSMGEFSRELCGGTHLDRTGAVGAFELLAEESVSAGTRRIVAVTGDKAQEYRDQTVDSVRRAAAVLGCPAAQLPAKTVELVNDLRSIKKELTAGKPGEHAAQFGGTAAPDAIDFATARGLLRETARTLNVAPPEVADRILAMLEERGRLLEELSRLAEGGKPSASDLMATAETVGTAKLIVAQTSGANPNLMRGWIDQLRKASDTPLAVLLGTVQDDKVVLVGGLSHALVDLGLSAGAWVGDTAKLVGGGGGGRPDMAQAGGKEPDKLPAALEQARAAMRTKLQAS
ncbi:MAG: alanine--tRNA ligase [Planctomycetaceae bacterium]